MHRLIIWLQLLACSLYVVGVCSLTSSNVIASQRHGFSSPKKLLMRSSRIFLQDQKISSAEASSTTMNAECSNHDTTFGSDRSLAGDYMLSVSSTSGDDDSGQVVSSWSLFPIDEAVVSEGQEDILADGARATYFLLQADFAAASLEPSITLTCSISRSSGEFKRSIEVVWTTKSNNGFDEKEENLLSVLERIMVQWAAVSNNHHDISKNPKEEGPWSVSLGSKHSTSPEPLLVPDLTSEEGARTVFEDLLGENNDDASSIEWVEMVTGNGLGVGRVPRKLVHSHNLLHRGIGLFVTKDVSMPMPKTDIISGTTTGEGDVPDLYVHRRASDKRIFPSLYDMFVGGVSLADEEPELTARREVAEELGLSNALLQRGDALAGPILKCVVCTAYNRCVVTLFSYRMDTQTETVHWQEEEVDWGDFVPYPTIVAAADRSIQRFADAETWPGSYPPIQSRNKGCLVEEETGIEATETTDEWKEWDFVPDGLLVWEAWLEMLRSESGSSV
jgi:8-oxo-dGTP pyrophosphatase MutT (NUDIX family)